MKKFTSFLCALAIVISASATPQLRTVQLTSKFAKAKNELPAALFVKKTAKKSANVAKPANDLRLKSSDFAKPAVAKAPKATNNVTVSAAYTGYYSQTYYAYQLYNEDGSIIFSFAGFPLADGATDVELGKTYTLNDLEPDYCYWFAADDSDYADYTACTFTKTTDANGKVKIVATATDENGDVWNLNYDENALPEAPKGGSYVADAVSGDYYSYSSDIQYTLTFTEEKLVFYFDILLPANEKDVVSDSTYTLESLDLDYSGGVFNKSTAIDYASVSFTKKVADDGSYTIQATVVDKNGYTWNLSAAKAAPKLSAQTLTLNGFVEAGSSFSQIEAADADSTVIVSLLIYNANPVGSFTEDDLFTYYSFVWLTGDNIYYVAKEADFTVTFDNATGIYTLTGTLLGVNEDDDSDQILFTLNLTLTGAATTEPGELPTTLSGSDFDLEIYGNEWVLEGYSDEGLYLAINGKSENVAGTYTAANLDSYYTYVTADGKTYYDMTDANLVVTYDNNVITVKGTLTVTNEEDATDVKEFDVDITGTYTVPTERNYQYDGTEAYTENFADYKVEDSYLKQNGVLYVEASNENNGTVGLAFFPFDGETTLVAGEYTITNSGAAGTLYAGSGLNSSNSVTYSFVGYVNENNQISAVWWLVAGKAVVSESGVIEIDALNSNGQTVKVQLGEYSEAIVNTNADVETSKRIENGNLVIIKNGVKYNAVGAIVK